MSENDAIREGDVGATFECAICSQIVYEWRDDWVLVSIRAPRSSARQELFIHKKCLARVVATSFPLGEVFEC